LVPVHRINQPFGPRQALETHNTNVMVKAGWSRTAGILEDRAEYKNSDTQN